MLGLFQITDDFGELAVSRAAGGGRRAYDQRRAGFIDQNRVDLVNDRVMQVALAQLVDFADHVVAQVIKAEFVVGAVGYVDGVGFLARRRLKMTEPLVKVILVLVFGVIYIRLIRNDDTYA